MDKLIKPLKNILDRRLRAPDFNVIQVTPHGGCRGFDFIRPLKPTSFKRTPTLKYAGVGG